MSVVHYLKGVCQNMSLPTLHKDFGRVHPHSILFDIQLCDRPRCLLGSNFSVILVNAQGLDQIYAVALF